jgi:hypothetical protein
MFIKFVLALLLIKRELEIYYTDFSLSKMYTVDPSSAQFS